MGLLAKKKNMPETPPMEAGTYPAVCIGIVDLGMQNNPKYNKAEDKVSLTFEMPDETIERGNGPEPRWLSKKYTKSLGDKSNLLRDLKAWLGAAAVDTDSFDIRELLGKACLVSVSKVENKNTGRVYNAIERMVALPKGMPEPQAKSEMFLFNMDDPATWDTLQKIPNFLREEVERSTSWAERQESEDMDIDDDNASVDMETGEITHGNADEPEF